MALASPIGRGNAIPTDGGMMDTNSPASSYVARPLKAVRCSPNCFGQHLERPDGVVERMRMMDGTALAPMSARVAAVNLLDSGGQGAFTDLNFGTELLRLVASNPDTPRIVRAYRPEPTVALSRRESLLPGFAAALTAAASFGFTPVIRPTGGRAVAMDQSCLVIDVVERVPRLHEGNRVAYQEVAGALASGLRSIGVDAIVGEVPDEFCPGEFSINARRETKIVGISQRVIPGARLVSAMVAIGDPGILPEVLSEVNRELTFPWRVETFGAVESEVGIVDFDEVSRVLRATLTPAGALTVGMHELMTRYT